MTIDFISQISFDKFSVELSIVDGATLLLARQYTDEQIADIDAVKSVTSTDNHIVVDNTDPKNPSLSFQLVDNENLLTDDQLALVESSVQPEDLPNFGDIITHDADEFAPSNHNHSLANLTERSYNSLTDLPNLSLLEDVVDVDTWLDSITDLQPPLFEGQIAYVVDEKYLLTALEEVIEETTQLNWYLLDFHWKIYVDKDSDSDFYGKLFIHNGIELIVVPDSLVLGETSSTAFDGLRGKSAYDHSQTTGNPHGTTAEEVGAAPIIHDHSGQSINPDNIVIDKQYTDITQVDLSIGTLFYNVDQLCWMLKTSADTYFNMGEELPMVCKNGDSSTHLEGQAVYISSGTGKLPVLQLTNSTIGRCNAIATQNVSNIGNARGYYCFFGQARTFPYANVIKSTDNAANWVEGAKLYLCSENGRYSTVKEAAPAKSMEVGVITDRSGANISVMFNPVEIHSVSDLSDVDGAATTVSTGDSFFLKVGNLWKTITESNFLTWVGNTFQTKLTFSTDIEADKASTTKVSAIKTFYDWAVGKFATITGGNTFTGVQTFSDNIKVTKIVPNADGTTAIQITKENGTTVVLNIDTTNNRIKIADKFIFGSDPGDLSYSAIYPAGVIPSNSNYVFEFPTAGGGTPWFNGGTGFIFAISNSAKMFLSQIGNLSIGFGGTAGRTKLDVNGDITSSNSHNLGYAYHEVSGGSPTADTVGDRRTSNSSGVEIKEKCTVSNATKGSGTWVAKQLSNAEKALTNNVDTNILDINCAINTMQSGIIDYSISAIDTASNIVRSHVGQMSYNVRNQNGVITTNIVHSTSLENDLGTITDTFTLTNGTNKATLSLTANAAGMTPTSMTLYMDIKNLGKNTVTLL